MSTPLTELFPLQDLAQAIADRTVVARKHPHRDLTILNYTERCQYERGLWNPVTLACRGLIHDGLGLVVARPFRKFFNYGQAEAPTFEVTEPCEVTDKVDGSLGILYSGADWRAIATRGSFDGEQARHATDLLNARYADFRAPEGWTVLFEIVYPENRIVLDYGQRDDLVLLGAVRIDDGLSCGPNNWNLKTWPGPRADVFEYATVADALAAEPRPNAEGLVIHLLHSGERVKVKQADYVALHKIVSGLNERAVWAHVAEGKPVDELLAALPDEFHGWVREVAARLNATVERDAAEIEHAYSTILTDLPPDYARKDFAMIAKDHPHRGSLFARHDGKNYRPGLWSAIRPSARNGPRGLAPTEEAA